MAGDDKEEKRLLSANVSFLPASTPPPCACNVQFTSVMMAASAAPRQEEVIKRDHSHEDDL